MKKFKDDIEILNRASPSSLGKRFCSFFIDFVLVMIAGFLLFLGGQNIVKAMPQYQQDLATVSEEIDYYNEYVSKTGVVQFVDAEKKIRKDDDIMVIENISRAIYHSYLKYNDSTKIEHVPTPGFVINEDDKVKQYGEASYETDTIGAFYTQFATANPGYVDFGGFSAEYYVNWLYKSQAYTNTYTMFIFEEDYSDIPTLKTDVAYALYHYLYGGATDETLTEQGKGYYRDYYDGYTYMLENSETRVLKAEPYYSTHYTVYRAALTSQSRYMNAALIISIMVGYLIIVLTPKLIFRHERTFGRFILGLGMIGNDGEEIPWWVTLSNTILGLVGFLLTAAILYIMPPFSGVYDTMMFPFIGNMALIMILIIIAVVGLINYIFSLFSHYKQSGVELLQQCVLVDKHHLDEIGDDK